MIQTKELKTLKDFQGLKKGDTIACEFHRDMHDYPNKYRFKVFKIANILEHSKEVILQIKNNLYFNYELFLNPKLGASNLKSAVLISSSEKSNNE